MRRSCLLALALLFLSAALAEARLSSPVVRKIKDSVVLVDVTLTLPDGDEGGSLGSGFVISSSGELLTNAHVVSATTETASGGQVMATDRQVEVIFHSGTSSEERVPARVVRENHDLDLALLALDRPATTWLTLGNSEQAQETSTLYVCGHPLGLREISFRQGSVTAHRVWEGHRYLEHDAMAESGNSGGPVVDEDGVVLGIHSLTLSGSNMMTKFAIPAEVVQGWLDSDPSDDPAPSAPGGRARQLLEAAGLVFTAGESGVFDLPYDNDLHVFAHQFDDFFRVYVPLEELAEEGDESRTAAALAALRFNYSDPVGRISSSYLFGHQLFWEAQIPLSAATPDFVGALGKSAAVRAAAWEAEQLGEEAPDTDFLYPAGDTQELLADLEAIIEDTGLAYERQGDLFIITVDEDLDVRVGIISGMVWTFCWISGMPGEDEFEQGENAVLMLERNWDDPFGRLSLDHDNDVLWESQVPASAMTPDYLAILVNTCEGQVRDFIDNFGYTPLNG